MIAGLLRRLWRERARAASVPAARRDDRALARRDARRARRRARDPGLVREGLRLFEELPRTATRDVLLATDLHAGTCFARSASRGS